MKFVDDDDDDDDDDDEINSWGEARASLKSTFNYATYL